MRAKGKLVSARKGGKTGIKLAGKKYPKLFALSWFGHRRDEKKRSKVTKHAAEKLIKIACTASIQTAGLFVLRMSRRVRSIVCNLIFCENYFRFIDTRAPSLRIIYRYARFGLKIETDRNEQDERNGSLHNSREHGKTSEICRWK